MGPTIPLPGTPLIHLKGVHKYYSSGEGRVHALSGIEFQVQAGEFIAIEGPSGCGKSTLLSILGLLERHDEGDYLLNGVSVAEFGFNHRAGIRNHSIGFIFQSFNLIKSMSVLDNVMLPLRYHRTIPRANHREAALDQLEKVGLIQKAQDLPHHLSGGQQQRVAIARAMVTDPSVILADEPTGNLDSIQARDILKQLKDLNSSGATILLVTHDASLAGMASRRIRMIDGRMTGDRSVA